MSGILEPFRVMLVTMFYWLLYEGLSLKSFKMLMTESLSW